MATATATQKKMFIDGKWCDADGGKTIGVINPATEEVLAEVAYGGRAETKRAIDAAAKAMPAWMKLTSWDRAKVLKKTADLMRERADAIAKTLTMEQGKPVAEAKAEILPYDPTFMGMPGQAIHEHSTCRMGADPKRSALNGFCQMHDVKNAFVVDGAAFTTASEKNPTLTILALAFRTAERIAET